ncbi:MAG: response regulator [Muribaculaceae bacterium]|nr:response regulator [Muribaculaceae bacterium]
MKATYIQNRNGYIFLALYMVIFLLGVNSASALNDVTVRLYDQREIMAGDYTALCQDHEGFLWIGTDAGLKRFDGNRCDIYRNDELDAGSLSNNKIVSLFCDSHGRMWIGTANGLNFFDSDRDAFRLVNLPGVSLNGFITDITELPAGDILFLVAGVGLYTVAPSCSTGSDDVVEAKRYKIGFDEESGISQMVNLGKEGLAISTRSGEVASISHGRQVEILARVDGNVTQISPEDSSNFIVTTQYEAFRLDMSNRTLVPLSIDGNETIKITDIHSNGDVTYIATAGSGMWSVRRGSTKISRVHGLYSSTFDLSSLKVGCVFTDKGDNLWFGCGHKGLAMAPSGNGSFTCKALNEILRNESGAEMMCMAVVGVNMVVGLNNGSVMVLEPSGSVKTVRVSNGAPVTSLASYREGQVLVGVAREGIWSLDTKSLAVSSIVKPSSPYPGVVISVGKKGEIVAAFGELGVLRYDPSTKEEKWFYPVGGSNLLSCFYYAGIKAVSDGKIWIGGYSGLACYDPDADGLVPMDQTPFLKEVINDICESDGGVMLATDRGLVEYSGNRGEIRKMTMLDGLPDNGVCTLERDASGGIWIGTMNGLAYYRDSESGIRTFGGNQGLKGTEYKFSGKLPSGRIVMGNYDSLVLFDPDSVRQSTFGGAVKVTGLFHNGKRIISGDESASFCVKSGSPSSPVAVLLDYKDNALVVRVSTMDFRDVSDLRYEWQIDGEEDKWHSSSLGESLIYLPPLQPGKHLLRIRGCENDVVSDISELKIDVKAPWYLSNMAYAGYLIVLCMIASLIYKVWKNKREEEMYEAKIRYFMDISHELRSPVTLMISPVETLLKQDHSPETTSQLLTVRRNAQRVLNLVDQLLDLRKIEKGKMRLVFSPVDIKAFVEELVEMFRPMAEEKELTMIFTCGFDHLWVEADRDNLDKILVNLISNAIKYTPKGGEVRVELFRTTDDTGSPRYAVTVTDTGIGLDNKVISHLFDRFYRNREHHHGSASGFGIGLDLCMRLVQLHKGELSARNREDGVKGSIFSLSLPLLPAVPTGSETDRDVKRPLLPDVVSGSADIQRMGKSSYRFRIMVVDDDEELREYVRNSLGPSYKVTALSSAEEALKELADRHPDLIVTDIRMNGIDGFELLRRVKGNMSTQHIPVILFSSANDADDRTKGWKRGADGYLAKPFNIEELEGMIFGLLDTRSKLKGKFSGGHESANAIVAPKVKGVDEDLMAKVNRYINDNISEAAMNVDALSEYVGLSRSQLHRRMKEIVGVAPSDYIRNVKLRKACEMLAGGDVDIAQVAYSLGFNAQSHFSTLFKRYTGHTPTEYRALAKEGKLGESDDDIRYDSI